MITMETIFHGNRMECFRSHCHCCRYLLRLVFPQKGAGEDFVLAMSEYCLGSQSELLQNRTDSNKQYILSILCFCLKYLTTSNKMLCGLFGIDFSCCTTQVHQMSLAKNSMHVLIVILPHQTNLNRQIHNFASV